MRQRRCDGEQVEVPRRVADDVEMVMSPCICVKNDFMECKPKTRLSVILPEIKFGGAWRIETSSWNAAQEMPGMEEMLQNLQAGGIVRGTVTNVAGLSKSGGQTKRFRYPKLEIDASMTELLSGAADVRTAIPASPEIQVRALKVASPEEDATQVVVDVIDVDSSESEIFETKKAAIEAGYDNDQVVKLAPGTWEATR